MWEEVFPRKASTQERSGCRWAAGGRPLGAAGNSRSLESRPFPSCHQGAPGHRAASRTVPHFSVEGLEGPPPSAPDLALVCAGLQGPRRSPKSMVPLLRAARGWKGTLRWRNRGPERGQVWPQVTCKVRGAEPETCPLSSPCPRGKHNHGRHRSWTAPNGNVGADPAQGEVKRGPFQGVPRRRFAE